MPLPLFRHIREETRLPNAASCVWTSQSVSGSWYVPAHFFLDLISVFLLWRPPAPISALPVRPSVRPPVRHLLCLFFFFSQSVWNWRASCCGWPPSRSSQTQPLVQHTHTPILRAAQTHKRKFPEAFAAPHTQTPTLPNFSPNLRPPPPSRPLTHRRKPLLPPGLQSTDCCGEVKCSSLSLREDTSHPTPPDLRPPSPPSPRPPSSSFFFPWAQSRGAAENRWPEGGVEGEGPCGIVLYGQSTVVPFLKCPKVWRLGGQEEQSLLCGGAEDRGKEEEEEREEIGDDEKKEGAVREEAE